MVLKQCYRDVLLPVALVLAHPSSPGGFVIIIIIILYFISLPLSPRSPVARFSAVGDSMCEEWEALVSTFTESFRPRPTQPELFLYSRV
jgi:hypothetical protein